MRTLYIFPDRPLKCDAFENLAAMESDSLKISLIKKLSKNFKNEPASARGQGKTIVKVGTAASVRWGVLRPF